ncbi:hypothetical protein B0H16DRAFT_284768 [Mycena metata]|uniref:Uncharacterized protein n=1 Tax=Mycena metata TaxID=1033252 RepID=A0AAD7HNZ8_9AGAR|nr:hypothetical protein B0H16DRAFT_284768 [Mycena metata]
MMATPSPGYGLRPKTSDIVDFFRAGNSSKSHATDTDADEPSSPAFLSEPESLVRKRSSRIPFLGRQRKKSTVSDASTSSAGPSNRQSDSDVRHSNVSRKPLPAVPPLDGGSEVSVSSSSPSPSLGSKLAARFAPSRQKFLNLSPRKPPPPSTNDPASDALPSPTSPSRGTSADSSSDHRSITPRPTHPTITVSLPPDNLEGYEGMFTLPTAPGASDPQRTPTAATPPVRFPTSQPSRHPAADTTVKRRSTRSVTEEKSSSRSSRIARKPIGDTFRRIEVDSTDAEDSEAVMSDSPKPSPSMTGGPTPVAEKRRTLATMPYSFSSPKSIMKSTSDRSPRPPVFPPPPLSDPPSSALPVIPSSSTMSRKSNGGPSLIATRQRAHTLSGLPASPLPISPPSSSSPLSTLPSRRITKSTVGGSIPAAALPNKGVEEPSGKENFDMEKASVEQLRQALALRNQQFDELASYLLKITEAHVAEKQALVKKVASLEQEATRRENEIKGLTWLVTNNPRPGISGPGSLGMLSNMASRSTSALELESEGQLSSDFTANDSGAESHQTQSGAEESYRESGPESVWGSGTSGGESSSSGRVKKAKRNTNLMPSFYRSSIKSGRLEAQVIPTALQYPSSPSTKRSSVSSFGSSSSSSTSSHSLGTLTPATTVISLSPIPETASARSQDPVVAAAILATENQRAKEERRVSRASNRLSAPSMTAPSPAAAYSANLKRTRPPSIAQVLAQSPKMEHGRDKLRSYGPGSASD